MMVNINIDFVLFLITNLINILMMGVFFARRNNYSRLGFYIGLVIVSMILPIGFAVVSNYTNRREWWTIVLPCLLNIFLIIELILDYILKREFRKTFLLVPFLMAYYLGLLAMIGYSFLINRKWGFITLIIYFINQIYTWFTQSGNMEKMKNI
jgi:hypothetical protein